MDAFYLFMLLTLIVICLSHLNNGDVIKLGYITGSQSPESGFYRRPGQAISGALTLALAEINEDPSVLPNTTLDVLIAETHGLELESIKAIVQLISEKVDVIIGPQETCIHEAKIAAAFNVPMISYFCSFMEIGDTQSYPTFARTKPTDSQFAGSVAAILNQFGWNKVTFVHSSDPVFSQTADTMHELMEHHGIEVTFRRVYSGPYFHGHTENPFTKVVADTYMETRIYVMLAQPYEFVGLMDQLQAQGLLDTGEYFVVGVHHGQYYPADPQLYFKGIFDSDESVSYSTQEAFRYFVAVVQSPPINPQYENFTRLVNDYLERQPFNFPNPYGAPKRIRPEAAYLYDAVWLYARAMQSALDDGADFRDGAEIIERVKGRPYLSAMGYMNRIDDLGNVEGNFSLIAWAEHSENQNEYGLYPVGVFSLQGNLTALPTFRFYEGKGVDWKDDKPPPDEPFCGYHGNKCQHSTGGSCPSSWVTHDGGCYLFNTTKLTWFRAKKSCQDQGAQLVVVNSQSESDFLVSAIKQRHIGTILYPNEVGYWTAGNDLAVEGQWAWDYPEGQGFSFSDWAPGEPNNQNPTCRGRTEDCLDISGHFDKGFHWNDQECTIPDFFVCEMMDSGGIIG